MKTQLRIVAGALRGRRLTYKLNPALRPAPQMVREALFSILGDAVPDRPFYDLFAGTGAIGLEALSRGAKRVVFVERDFRTADDIERHAREFGVADDVRIVRADGYRWSDRWAAPTESVNVFLGPPYADYQRRLPDLLRLVADIQIKMAPGSILILQAEQETGLENLPDREKWETRRYGRNMLLIWIKEIRAPGLS